MMAAKGGRMKRTVSHAEAFAVALVALLTAVPTDILGYILRAIPAEQKSIYALHGIMLVSKSWRAAAREVLADMSWLKPFTQAARTLCARTC